MQAELTKEEQALFDEMSQDKGEPPAEKKADDGVAEAAAKAEQEKAAKEAADKAAADAKGKEKEHSMVPAEALREARADNKELRKELESMKNLVSEGDKKLQKFIESVSKKADAEPGPKFEDDPAGNLKHKNEQLEKALAEIQAKLDKQEGASQQSDKLTQHANFVTTREQAFAKENPDYFQAAEYVAQVWRDEFTETGFKAEDIPKLVFGKSLAITSQATQSQKDPAEAIYKIAKRYGFTPKAKDEPKKEEKKEDGETKLKQIERGLEASKSAGGGSGPDDLSLASLAQLDDEAIDKLVADKDWWAKNIKRSPLH